MVSSTDSDQRRTALWTAVALAGIVVLSLFLRSYWDSSVAHPNASTWVLSGGSDPYYHARTVFCIVFGDTPQTGCTPGMKPWTHFLGDPLLNYPQGSINPNPPLYDWMVATTGYAVHTVSGADLVTSEWMTLEWAPAILGAATTIVLYFLGKEVWSRKAGILAAFFWAVGASAIDDSSLGDSTHYAAFGFFISLAMLFYIMMLNSARSSAPWVQRWRSRRSIADGLGRFVSERPAVLAYGALSGMAVAAVALVWKGFPYVLGIMFLYGTVQLLLDHWRSRESIAVFTGTLVAFAVGLYAALPYYLGAGILSFLLPSLYMFIAWIVVGLVLVPTRDLPSIIVMPAFVVLGILGLVAMYFAFPAVWKSAFFATTYFSQTSLYKTIAEAQPADFDAIMFGIGPVIAVMAIVGLGWMLLHLRKETRPVFTFIVVWLVVAIYMAHSASRFLFNAAPAFALLGGVYAAVVLEWTNFAGLRREFAGASTFWTGFRRGVQPRHYVTAISFALILVLPQAALAFDAATPPDTELQWQGTMLKNWLLGNGYKTSDIKTQAAGCATSFFSQTCVNAMSNLYIERRITQTNAQSSATAAQTISQDWIFYPTLRMGAFGQSFLDSSWQTALSFLERYASANYSTDPAQRAAFLAWWDYGHWAISVGHVPTVADNFQNGYQFTAQFLLAQNETHAIELLSARTLLCVQTPGATPDPTCAHTQKAQQLSAIETALNVNATSATTILGKSGANPSGLLGWKYVNLTEDQSVKLLNTVEEWTGCPATPRDTAAPAENLNTCKRIRFFTTDVRMMPIDDPAQSSIQQPSIFYAPVVLKGDNPDNYVQTLFVGSDNNQYTQTQLQARQADPHQEVISVTGEKLQYYAPFFNSMYYRGFVGTQPQGVTPGVPVDAGTVFNITTQGQVQPGFGLQHFRLIYADSEIRMLEYYQGVNVTGKVVDARTGAAVPDVTVGVYDDFGTFHSSTTTDANGTYSILAPFATGNPGNPFVFFKNGVRVGQFNLSAAAGLSHAAAEAAGSRITAPTFHIGTGTVQGNVTIDLQNGKFDTNTSLAGLQFQVGGVNVTVDQNHHYKVTASAGDATPSTTNATYTFSPGVTLTIAPNATANQDIHVIYRPVNVTGKLTLSDVPGTPNFALSTPTLQFLRNASVSPNTAVNASANQGTVTIDAHGNFTTRLTPGSYVVNLTTLYHYQPSVNATQQGPYELVPQALVVRPGEGAITVDYVLTRLS